MARPERRSLEEFLRGIVLDVDERGYIRKREGITLEFKESFGFASLPRYMRTIAAFANNRGGVILFGITNSPRRAVGIDAERFDLIDPEKITSALNECFDPAIMWGMGTFSEGGKTFGYFYVREARDKPVICRKTHDKYLKSGEIYFRYHAQSRVIGYTELRKIIDAAIEKERTLWLRHLSQIARIGPRNVAFLDLISGGVSHGEMKATFVIDEDLLKRMKNEVIFLDEGVFKEKEGAPALRLVGDIIPAGKVLSLPVSPEANYPYLAKELAEILGLRPYDVHALVWKLGLKEDDRFCARVRFGKKAETPKYSELALRKLQEIVESNGKDFVEASCREYTQDLRERARLRKASKETQAASRE